MKKIFLSLFGALASISGFAQYLPDSTVQIIAYWSKGDKITYECQSKQVRKLPNGEELTTNSSAETRVFEVLDSTENSYVVQLGYQDVMTLDGNVDLSNELLQKLAQNIKLKFRTDEYGSLQELVDLDNTISTINQQTTVLIDDMYSRNEKIRQVFTKEQMSALISSICTPQYLATVCLDEVSPLLMYHGSKLSLNEEYTIDQDITVGNVSLSGQMHFWFDSEASDSTFAIFRSYMKIDDERVWEIGKNMVSAALVAAQPDIDVTILNEEIDKYIKDNNVSAVIEQFTATGIHVDSGWTTDWIFDRVFKMKDNNGETQIIDTRKVLMKDSE